MLTWYFVYFYLYSLQSVALSSGSFPCMGKFSPADSIFLDHLVPLGCTLWNFGVDYGFCILDPLPSRSHDYFQSLCPMLIFDIGCYVYLIPFTLQLFCIARRFGTLFCYILVWGCLVGDWIVFIPCCAFPYDCRWASGMTLPFLRNSVLRARYVCF